MLLGELYGPSDLYSAADPWKTLRPGPPQNPILSDLAFANLPWRAAVRESLAHGRLPFWNRFVLAGNPLLGTAQAGVLHPSTWLGVWLPVPLSWTFSCTFTLFLGLLAGFLFFRDFGLGKRAALVGAVGWGFSTYMVFWNGWSVGPSTATFPLLLLGLRRLARAPGLPATGLTVAALWLSFCGGHPESFFHSVAAGGVYFLWELAGAPRRLRLRAVGHGARGRRPRTSSLRTAALPAARGDPALGRVPRAPPGPRRGNGPAVGPGRRGGRPSAARRASVFPRHLWKEPRRRGSQGRIGDAHRIRGRRALSARVPRVRRETARPRPRDVPRLLSGGSRVRRELSRHHGPDGAAARFRARPELPAGLSRRPRDRGPGRVRDGSARDARRRARARSDRRRVGGRGVRRLPDRAPRLRGEGPFPGVHVDRARLRDRAPRSARARRARGEGGGAAHGDGRARAARRAAVPGNARHLSDASGVDARAAAADARSPCRSAARRRASSPRGDVFRPNAAALYGIEDVRGYESLVLDRFADTFPLWSQRPGGVVQPRGRSRVGAPLPVAAERGLRDRRARRCRCRRDGASRRADRSSRSSPTPAPCRAHSSRGRCGA